MRWEWVGGFVLFAATDSSWAAPRLEGHVHDTRCIETWKMARTAFEADNWSLHWPVAKPINRNIHVIFTQASEDISGGEAVTASNAFDQSASFDFRPIFWQKSPQGRSRLVIVDYRGNWQGDGYAVYLLPAGFTAADFKKGLAANDQKLLQYSLPNESGYAVPLVLTDHSTDRDWVIDRGEPYKALANWRVFAPSQTKLKSLCRISFGVPKTGGLAILPSAVKRFAAAADEALGPGRNEGTLQPTARIRLDVANGWDNAALRPWAMNYHPYNSRVEIYRGLNEWAEGNPKRNALRKGIFRSIAPADISLSTYYTTNFDKSVVEGKRLSRHVLDNMLRSYFVFPKNH